MQESWAPGLVDFIYAVSVLQGRNEVYGIRDQRQKMGWDHGSQALDLGSQAVGSGSVVLRGDQGSSFPTENHFFSDQAQETIYGLLLSLA